MCIINYNKERDMKKIIKASFITLFQSLFLFINVGYGLECEEGEVDLGWDDCNDWNSSHTDGCMSSGCYSIEETTFIQFYETTGNLLQGDISPKIGDLVNLTLLRLDDVNQLTGVIPPEIGNLTNLSILTLENNQLTGEIPSEIENTNLEILKLTNNQLTGDLPSEIWNLTDLRQLNLSDNQLTGEIPSEIEFLTSLTDLELANNQLTGEIPIELWSMNQNSLNFFDLSNNQLVGEIPDEIENSMFIFGFYLNDNQLSGSIPENTCQIVFLPSYSDQFKFGNNNFCPPYPSCLVNLEPYIDENGNGEWDEGESYEDSNGNGVYEENYVGEQDTSNCNGLSDDCIDLTGVDFGECEVALGIGWVNSNCEYISGCDLIVDSVDYSEATFSSMDSCLQTCMSLNDDNDFLYPRSYNLHNNYPNPFNPFTTIRYDLPEASHVRVTVYDMLGNVINNLVSINQSSGYKSVQWDATNNQGQPVSAGVYFYSIEARDFRQTKKMILLK